MLRSRIFAVIILLGALGLGWFIRASEGPDARFPFKLGLDLSGGTQLIYDADLSKVAPGEERASMAALRDTIERRVNLFGVSEPVVQVEQASAAAGGGYRLLVELPGVTDLDEAARRIGETPLLEFKLASDLDALVGALDAGAFATGTATSSASSSPAAAATSSRLAASTSPASALDALLTPTGLTGSLLRRATVGFDQNTGEPYVSLQFNDEGRELFAVITRENVGRVLAIVLDGVPISLPYIREEIANGEAQVSGSFTVEEARTLSRDLNYGSLPVPISLASTQSIGPSLGIDAVSSGIRAGLIGLGLVGLFLIIWYRLPGLMAVLSLGVFVAVMLALFKLIPVTLTAAGIAGLILSIGMSVDGNILVFERLREELAAGRTLKDALEQAFGRAWTSIRDGNLSGLLVGAILFWFGTPLVKGFALTMMLGIVVSVFSSITVTRTFLRAILPGTESTASRLLFGSGLAQKGVSASSKK